MARDSEEPARARGAPVGILLVNLGTPDAPTPQAVRAYLKEFLSDPRVVEIPRIVWWPILNLFVLPTRPKASAARYAQIWTRDGSPLRVYTERQTILLQGYLGDRMRAPLVIEHAMRYGRPSIRDKVRALETSGCTRILVIPLYPQYSSSTTGSALDAVGAAIAALPREPEVRTVRDFHDDPRYIAALAASVRDFWEKRGRPELLVMSFHGVPRRSVERGDPYYQQCLATATLLAQALGLAEGRFRATFQSRFGRAEWLQPYTADVLTELGRARMECVDIVCPGFVSDCLETLEEIAIEGKQLFMQAGGRELRYIPCLNDRDLWIKALTDITARNLHGWVEPALPDPPGGRFRSFSAGMGA